MYVVEHALLNLAKNIGKNILIAVVIFAIITATVIALAIHSTSRIAIEETRMALQSAVRVIPVRQVAGSGGAMTPGGGEQSDGVSLEQYQLFAESEFLDGADIKQSNRGVDGVDAVYYLKRPDMIGDFEAELRSKGLPDGYSVRTDESAFESVAGPVESLKNLSLAFLAIVLVLGAVIMVLLAAIAIRERKYEIGVLRAMGMKKHKVALGLLTEIIAITCICFVLGMGAGTALSQPIADAIMTGQSDSPAAGSTSLADRLSGAEAGQSAQTEKIDVAVSGITALQILAVSFFLASIAGILSISRITKYEPIKILMERD